MNNFAKWLSASGRKLFACAQSQSLGRSVRSDNQQSIIWYVFQSDVIQANTRDDYDILQICTAQPDQAKANAVGKAEVQKKGLAFVKGVKAVHRTYTSEPLVTGNHFVVARELDMTLENHGRIQKNELMLCEVREGKIDLEQFFYYGEMTH
ncbi:MAG TPA: SnoaL-like domain-containing protein [Puia sp.]|nr:SnoaL-like domain-containing protein [Puia sp.]